MFNPKYLFVFTSSWVDIQPSVIYVAIRLFVKTRRWNSYNNHDLDRVGLNFLRGSSRCLSLHKNNKFCLNVCMYLKGRFISLKKISSKSTAWGSYKHFWSHHFTKQELKKNATKSHSAKKKKDTRVRKFRRRISILQDTLLNTINRVQ